MITNTVVFGGNIALDGDISDFFAPGTTNLLPGVCVRVDPNGIAPGLEGLDEPPLDSRTVKGAEFQVSGFNQRRILSAYDPNLFGGTIFVGIDLPGGTGSLVNTNFMGSLGPTNVGLDGRVGVRPFDADGNGDPQSIGRVDGRVLSRCSDPGANDATVDIIACGSALSLGFTDAVDPMFDPGNKERYAVSIMFGDGTQVQIELFEDNLTQSNKAGLNLFSIPPGLPFGVGASLSTNANPALANTVLGFDVEFAITNVNQAVANECARLSQLIEANSGSLQDGSPNGEDANIMQCVYVLPSGIDVTKACPTNPVAPGEMLTFTATVRNTGQVTIAAVTVTNFVPGIATNRVFGPANLAPGASMDFSASYLVPTNIDACAVNDTLLASGFNPCVNAAVTAMATASCPLRTTPRLALAQVCPVAPVSPGGLLVVTGAVCNAGDISLDGIFITNTAAGLNNGSTNGPFRLGLGECLPFTNSIQLPSNYTACVVTAIVAVQATSLCGSNITATASTNCPVQHLLLITCPPGTNFQCLSEFPPPNTNDVTVMSSAGGVVVMHVEDIRRIDDCTNTITRIYEATDACGNRARCSQTIIVLDTTPPLITCATNRTVECGTVWSFDAPSATDNCSGTNVTIRIVSTATNTAGFCGNTFSAIRTWEATDTCSNRAMCSQTITVVDTSPPIITCASNRTVECNTTWSFEEPSATDACDGTNVTIRVVSTVTNTTGFCGATFSATRTWEAIDTCTNSSSCSQTITVVDTTPPSLTCASNLTVECGTAWDFTPPTAALDICGGTNVVVRVVSTVTNAGVCPVRFEITRTWEALDACTNRSTCSQTIRLMDTIAPTLICGSNLTVECGMGWDFTPPTATDTCDGTNVVVRVLSTVTNAGTCPVRFEITRTWEALDVCSNRATCSQIVRLTDTTVPSLTCASNLTVECGMPWQFTPPQAVDNCDGTNVVVSVLSTVTNTMVTCPLRFTATRTWEATDTCSNRAMCSQTITVVDASPPIITCASNRMVECNTTWTFEEPSATDACDGTNVTIRLVSTVTNTTGFCGTTFSATRTWEAIDTCTNSSSCSQTITVVDTTPPSLTCASNLTVECGTAWDFTPPTAALDICGGTNVVVRVVSTVTNAGVCPVRFEITRTWEVLDACTNRSTCSQTVRLLDTKPPMITCPPTNFVQCLSEVPACPTNLAGFLAAGGSASDACSPNDLIFVCYDSALAGSQCDGTILRTNVVSDGCNSASCVQTIRIRDTTPPMLVGVPPNQTYPSLADVPPPAQVTAIDNCDGTNVPVSVTASTNAQETVVVYCWTATDLCSNSVTACQTNFVAGTPCIRVVKFCPPNPVPPNGPVVFTGCVTNCGNVTLTNVIVVNDQPTNFTLVFGPTNLAPGQGMCFSGRYTCGACGPFIDTLVAMGSSSTTGEEVMDWDTAVCPGTTSPGLVVKKFCPATNVPPGGRLFFSGFVSNSGNVALTNVVVRNDRPTSNTLVLGPFNLAPGFARSFMGSYLAPQAPGPYTDTLTATGNDPCTGLRVSAQATASCPSTTNVVGRACIDVIKQISCVLPPQIISGVAYDACSTFDKLAVGVRSGDQLPGFCYSITVKNCGDVPLGNLRVVDSALGDLTSAFFPPGSVLRPREEVTLYYKMAWGHDTTNTVTATGSSAALGTTVSDSDSAIALVDRAALLCRVIVTSPDDRDHKPDDDHVSLPRDHRFHRVTYEVFVCNVGEVDLVNVTVRDVGLAALGCTDQPKPFKLAAGHSKTVPLCDCFVQCPGLTNTVTVVAEVDTSREELCAFDFDGKAIVVFDRCTGVVDCRLPGGARVMGSGKQTSALTYPTVKTVTHSGEVSGPLGFATEFDPDSACIQGQWEHVRQDRGKEGRFCACSFDSFLAACLGCPNAGDADLAAGELCDPNDACGSGSRQEPGNKVAFSGLGEYTPPSGRRTPSLALFRIDVEDHGEPGSGQKKGPADRYRIRLWILTDHELRQLADPDDQLLDFRMAIAASEESTLTQDGANVPRGARAFGVRRPDVDDGGPLSSGNEQISPMQKDCQ